LKSSLKEYKLQAYNASQESYNIDSDDLINVLSIAHYLL